MGLFDRLFAFWRERQDATTTFKLLNGYQSTFRTWGGRIYESELVRAAIDARARHISKLQIVISGTANPSLQTKLKLAPNEWQSWSQFLYRLSTILDVQTTAFIVPILDRGGETTGIYPILPDSTELVEYAGRPWIRFRFNRGKTAAIELEKVGILTKYQYSSDMFGERNEALRPTMELIHIQNQAIEEGVKNSATYRFMARLDNFTKAEDLKKERERFGQLNFIDSTGGGVLLWPNTYTDIKQINSTPFVADSKQMELIRANVFDYFGVNENVLQNKTIGDEWSAFYEGAIEPFAIQLSDVLTKMLFTLRERQLGAEVMATANRLQYMSNSDKLEVSSQMLDRGIISINDARTIWNLPPVEGGDVRIIRGEYYSVDDKVDTDEATEAEAGGAEE